MKIDCTVTENFLRECSRMCKSSKCSECGFERTNFYGESTCVFKLRSSYPNHISDIIDIVQKWSDDHPRKTRREDLKEKYPNVSHPEMFPCVLDYCSHCENCPNFNKNRFTDCWDEPVEGGATGREVEACN